MKITDKYIFFYKEWPGNYTKSNFSWNEFGTTKRFFCTEQAFMWAKAKYFDDNEIANKILNCNIANTCRLLGRQVNNYVDSEWDKVRYEYMYECNLSKYSQDIYLKNLLIDHKFDDLIFVEASPIDRIWGIGMDENNPLINNCNNWRGKNLLGKILTKIRKEVING